MGSVISFQKEFALILVGAIIFTASLLWKDLLADIEEVYFPKAKGLLGRIFYTVIVTIILIAVAIHLKRILGISKPGEPSITMDEMPIDEDNIHITDQRPKKLPKSYHYQPSIKRHY